MPTERSDEATESGTLGSLAMSTSSDVLWLRWADARALSDVEFAVDYGRLVLLRRIRAEALAIEDRERRLAQLPQFLRSWVGDDDTQKESERQREKFDF